MVKNYPKLETLQKREMTDVSNLKPLTDGILSTFQAGYIDNCVLFILNYRAQFLV